MPTPASYVGIEPMRYEVVIECDGFVMAKIQTNSMDTANAELLKPLDSGHDWKVTMFIAGEIGAFRYARP